MTSFEAFGIVSLIKKLCNIVLTMVKTNSLPYIWTRYPVRARVLLVKQGRSYYNIVTTSSVAR